MKLCGLRLFWEMVMAQWIHNYLKGSGSGKYFLWVPYLKKKERPR